MSAVSDRNGEIPPLNWPPAFAALVIGVALFAVADVASGLTPSFLTAFTALLTPLFALPLAAELIRQKQMRWYGGFYFVFALAAIHFWAIVEADKLYPQSCYTFFPEPTSPHAPQACEAPATTVWQHAFYAARSGAVGGLIGAVFSFAGFFLFFARLRRARNFALAGGATVVLAALGIVGLSITRPDLMTGLQYALYLFVPWQLVFGAMVLGLFDARRAGAREVVTN